VCRCVRPRREWRSSRHACVLSSCKPTPMMRAETAALPHLEHQAGRAVESAAVRGPAVRRGPGAAAQQPGRHVLPAAQQAVGREHSWQLPAAAATTATAVLALVAVLAAAVPAAAVLAVLPLLAGLKAHLAPGPLVPRRLPATCTVRQDRAHECREGRVWLPAHCTEQPNTAPSCRTWWSL
jgi:hypothetical protein